FIKRTPTPHTSTLSLHDALPISGQTVFIPSKLFIQKPIKVFLPSPHYPRSISDDSTISIFNTATLSHILVLPYYLLCCSEHILTFIFLLNHFSKSPDILTLG